MRNNATHATFPALVLNAEKNIIANKNFVQSISLLSSANQFVEKSLWLIIGDRDKRVWTR